MHFLIHHPKTNLRRIQAGAQPAETPARVQSTVGIIPVVGVLSQRPEWFECGSTYTGICAALERFEAEPSISAIILDVDSCGGSADGAFETAEKIRACTKPVVAYGRGLVASAAYLLFSAANSTADFFQPWRFCGIQKGKISDSILCPTRSAGIFGKNFLKNAR